MTAPTFTTSWAAYFPARCAIVLLASLIAGCAGAPSRPPQIDGKLPGTDSTVQGQVQESTNSTDVPTGVDTSNVFTGTDRRGAKTSLASGLIEPYPSVVSLRSTLRTDDYMRSLGIRRSAGSGRSAEEQRNTRVDGFIYAAKKESDNDFHLIVGDRLCTQGSCLITVEISGIPAELSNPDRRALIDARCKFLAHFSGKEPGRSQYIKYDPPLHVSVTGSPFFDVDHPAGIVGPAKLKPDTAWEIHPVSDITFEP